MKRAILRSGFTPGQRIASSLWRASIGWTRLCDVRHADARLASSKTAFSRTWRIGGTLRSDVRSEGFLRSGQHCWASSPGTTVQGNRLEHGMASLRIPPARLSCAACDARHGSPSAAANNRCGTAVGLSILFPKHSTGTCAKLVICNNALSSAQASGKRSGSAASTTNTMAPRGCALTPRK